MKTPKQLLHFLSIFVLSLSFMFCSSNGEADVDSAAPSIDIALQINELVAEDKYTEALELLEDNPIVLKL